MKEADNKGVKKSSYEFFGLTGVVLLGLSLRIWNLEDLPAQLFGDVITHWHLAEQMRSNTDWWSNWYGGDGPVVPLLSGLVAKGIGVSFLSLKLISVVGGVLGIGATYLMAKALVSRRVGMIAAYLTAVSFWSISFSRQAKPYIWVPLIVALVTLLLVKRRYILSGILTGVGVFVQASFWGGIGFLAYSWQGAVAGLPFLWLVRNKLFEVLSPETYVGEKLAVGMALSEVIPRLMMNFRSTVGLFFWRGDPGFRATIPGEPLLDWVSRVFLMVGLGILVYEIMFKRNRKLLVFLLLPALFLQLPAVLDVNNYQASPNAGRLLGLLPIVVVVMAMGVNYLWQKIPRVELQWMIPGLLLIVGLVQSYWYFKVYPLTLPNKNTPFARIIAEKLNVDYETSEKVMMGGGWGEWGQPERDSVPLQLNDREKMIYVEDMNEWKSKAETILQKGEVVIVLAPEDKEMETFLKTNQVGYVKEYLQVNEWTVAKLLLVHQLEER